MVIVQETASTPVRLAYAERAGWQLGRTVGLPLGFAVLAMLAWEILCRIAEISPELLPPPSAVWKVLVGNPPILIEHTVPTTYRDCRQLCVATVVGVALAIAITFSAAVREAIYPNIVLIQMIPKIALAPLFIVWLGVGSRSCIVVAVFIAFFPVVVSTATGLVSAKPDVLQLCRSLTASEWQMFRLARFPYAMPYVFAGMKVGVTMAMIGVIVGEFITAQAGLGYIIMFASSAGETATVLAAIVLLCGIGLALVRPCRARRTWRCGVGMVARCRSVASYDCGGDGGGAVISTASLPMYNLPEMRAANARFWGRCAEYSLRRACATCPRPYLRPTAGPGADWPGDAVLADLRLPAETVFTGRAIRLGTPSYDAPGCDGPTHRAFFIVPDASRHKEPRDLKDSLFLLNSPVIPIRA